MDPLPPLREVIRSLGLSAKRGLGQNFLFDLNITRKIARHVPDLARSHVIEIGPGPGGLTRGLLEEGAAKVTAIEKDRRFAPALEAIAKAWPGRVEIVIGDALETEEAGLAGNHGLHLRIAANLPYNVATPLLAKWLTPEPWPPVWASLTVMLQREVAARLAAKPGSKTFGRLSVLAQWRARPKILFNVPAEAFVPRPKVTSAVVEIIPAEPAVKGLKGSELSAFTAVLFGQRRKTLRNVLGKKFPKAEPAMEEIGVSPGVRAETLTVEQVCRLAKRLGPLP